MAKETLHFVRSRPFSYGMPAVALDQGQVFELTGQPLDEKLVRIGYVEKVKDPRLLEQCGVCGAKFVAAGYLKAHGEKRHKRARERDFDAVRQAHAGGVLDSFAATEDAGEMLVDVTGDKEERQLEREAPLYWEKTTASLKGGS